MKGVSSDVAARAIMQSCRKRFPETKKQKKAGTKMPQVETSKVDGTLQNSSRGYIAKIYNGASNEKVTIQGCIPDIKDRTTPMQRQLY
ncbi:hypothetical protein HKBW3S42_01507 [Candidatus Hakubella thermalkaliphila]|uniref:Uncharacterized protein n=1 Tax=Candidatus Hakubella thermalkaliphila TaxID=2754717 RepID=A0A6V8PKJ0_9ACTN|nr:hypothetical protein HKBW3S42_01507 [Candidatus Hakubella thermalkaliphila]